MNSYGLALGGGGTKGAYHLGVWKALEDMKINICAVTGCSIGSVNGALFAQGDYDIARKIWININRENILELSKDNISDNLLDIKNLSKLFLDMYKNNGLDTKPFRDLIEKAVDEEKLRKSEVDFGLVTYDLAQREELSLFINEIPKGQLVDYLMASASLPGLKKTIIDEKEYIDGGLANNIPYDMLIEKGIKNIIAVDVGGVGIKKVYAPKGVNIINIKTSESIVGMLDFTLSNIEKTIRAGYVECLRAFGRVEGEIYSFNVSDYHKQRQKYSKKLMDGIECAAEIFGVDRYKVYKFSDLVNGVLEKYKEYRDNGKGVDDKQVLVKFTGYILGEKLDDTVSKFFSGLMSDVTNAANSIAYFLTTEYKD